MTTSHHFGKGIDTSIFTPNRTTSMGDSIGCIGHNKHNTKAQWFGYINNGTRIDPHSLTFCNFCAKNYFTTEQVFEVLDTDYPYLKPKLVCDTPITDVCLKYGIDKRCVHYRGIRFNVNLIDESNKVWIPTMIIPTEAGSKASYNGVGIFPIPTMCYWEFVVKIDPNGKYNYGDYYLKIKKAQFGDGRMVNVSNKHGNTNIFTPASTNLIINSYKTGVAGERFFFVSPPKLEIDHGLEAEHNNESNKLYLTISIHKKVMNRVLEEEVVYRGGPPKKETSNPFKSPTIGSPGYTGGSNFGASGYSSNLDTHTVDATFPEVDSIDIIVQLVNNQSQEELISANRIVQAQVDAETHKKISKLEHKRNLITKQIDELRNPTDRSKLFGHLAQSQLLI